MASRAPVRRPELGELEALVTALRCGSIGEAARRLGVSQPALSKRLRQLEAVCGAPLLERSPRGVVATPAGSRLAAAALRVVDEVALLDEVMAELRGQRAPVRVASSPVVADRLLPELLAAARDDLAGVPIELTAANSSVVRRLVATGAADLGIAATEDPGADAGAPLIATDELVLAVPPGHPWAAREAITLEELAGASLVLRDPRSHARTFVDGVLQERGLAPIHPLAELGSTAAAVTAAVETATPAVLSSLALGGDTRVVARPIEGVRLARRFVLLAAVGWEQEHAVQQTRQALITAAAGRGGAR